MAPRVGVRMRDRNMLPARISPHQSENARSSKNDHWKFQKTSTKSRQALKSFSNWFKVVNTLIYASFGYRTEEKDGSEERVSDGSCNTALIDSHSLVILPNKVGLMTWMLGRSGCACHIDLSMGAWMLEGTEVFDWHRGIQARYGNSRWWGCRYTVHSWAPQEPSKLTMTGDWGGGVGMALTLAPIIMNPGRQSSADAQHVWRGADMTLFIQRLLWSIRKKWGWRTNEDHHDESTSRQGKLYIVPKAAQGGTFPQTRTEELGALDGDTRVEIGNS